MPFMSRLCLIALLTVLTVVPAFSFTFEPMVATLSPSGPEAVQTFHVANEGTGRLAVQFAVYSRASSLEGVELNTDASDLFTIYPTSAFIEPGASASVKLQWHGPAHLLVERCFRFVAQNVALDAGLAKTSGIKVMFRYVASVYVGGAAVTPKLETTVLGTERKQGENGYTIEIVNNGSRHVVVDSASLEITTPEGDSVQLDSEQLEFLSGFNYLPGCPVRLFIPRSEAVPGRIYDARLNYEPEF